MTNTPTIKASFEMEIPFFDVDTYKIVWHGNYAKYFEIARCELLERRSLVIFSLSLIYKPAI